MSSKRSTKRAKKYNLAARKNLHASKAKVPFLKLKREIEKGKVQYLFHIIRIKKNETVFTNKKRIGGNKNSLPHFLIVIRNRNESHVSQAVGGACCFVCFNLFSFANTRKRF